jgi:hypothetical protein
MYTIAVRTGDVGSSSTHAAVTIVITGKHAD